MWSLALGIGERTAWLLLAAGGAQCHHQVQSWEIHHHLLVHPRILSSPPSALLELGRLRPTAAVSLALL